jgi:hypothetical protein
LPSVTTQGRVYTALWNGDLSILDPTANRPEIPISVTQVTKRLSGVAQAAQRLSNGRVSFVMALDKSNAGSAAKFQKVKTALEPHFSGEPILCFPHSLGLLNLEKIAPTVEIAIFKIRDIERNDVHELVKSAVYVQSKNSERSKFNILTHGIIFDAGLA